MSWRPWNETPADLEHEAEAAAKLEAKFNVNVKKLSVGMYNLDWGLYRKDKLVAWAEFKRRSERYHTLFLSFAKWEHGCRLARESKKPLLIVVHWPDGLYVFKWKDDYTPEVKLERNRRGQNGDEEPCAHIHSHLFKRIAD
jgi:hypothetical protein